MTHKFYQMTWHNFINGEGPCSEIREQAECCVNVARVLEEGETDGILEITSSEVSPSMTKWEALDSEKYKELCEKHGVNPEDFSYEEDDDDDEEGG